MILHPNSNLLYFPDSYSILVYTVMNPVNFTEILNKFGILWSFCEPLVGAIAYFYSNSPDSF
jgi:hypothetical protein